MSISPSKILIGSTDSNRDSLSISHAHTGKRKRNKEMLTHDTIMDNYLFRCNSTRLIDIQSENKEDATQTQQLFSLFLSMEISIERKIDVSVNTLSFSLLNVIQFSSSTVAPIFSSYLQKCFERKNLYNPMVFFQINMESKRKMDEDYEIHFDYANKKARPSLCRWKAFEIDDEQSIPQWFPSSSSQLPLDHCQIDETDEEMEEQTTQMNHFERSKSKEVRQDKTKKKSLLIMIFVLDKC